MVERSFYMREVPGSVTQNFQLLRGARKSKKELQEAILLDKKKSLICKSNMRKGSLRNSTELAEKGIGVPNRQSLPQKDVEGYISTPLMSESKTCLWHKKLLWTPLARQLNRKGKRLACEKHMDWWPASTKPISERYEIEDSVQLMHQQKKAFKCH